MPITLPRRLQWTILALLFAVAGGDRVAGGEAPGHLQSIVRALAPAVGLAKKKDGDAVEHAVRINAKFAAAALAQTEPVLGRLTQSGHVKVLAAKYDLSTGQVEIFP